MAFIRRSYSEITDAILSQITKGIAKERHDHTAGRAKYRLGHSQVREIIRLEGTLNGSSWVFSKGSDFRLSEDMLEWLDSGDKPDDKTPFFVNYRLDAPSEITDINPGSVIRTIVESVALEMDYLYAQMNQIYDSGFIDTATGKSLDLVVSLLGITRKPAGFATGVVTFGRERDPEGIPVNGEAHIYEGKNRIPLRYPGVKTLERVYLLPEGEVEKSFDLGKDCQLFEDSILWQEGGKRPDPGTNFYADYVHYEKIVIPVGSGVSYSGRPSDLKVFRTVEEAALSKRSDGRWEADLMVEASSVGKRGNVHAGVINFMPKPIMGIEYVLNKQDITNGTEEESDLELRKRAKRALEMAGKATLVSLKSAVESVAGVVGEVKVVDRPDGVPGLVQIVASGGDPREIEKVINETRSAGIKVEHKEPEIVPIDVSLTIYISPEHDSDKVKREVGESVKNYFSSLNIDADIILSRIINSAMGVSGVSDVRDVSLNGQRKNVVTLADEKGELRNLEIFLEVG